MVHISHLYSSSETVSVELDNIPICAYTMFNRHGGVSKGEYSSLNVSYGVGDEEVSVNSNREIVKKKTKVSLLLSAKQVHGDNIYCLTDPVSDDVEIDSVDALVTDIRNVGLMIQQADCQAVLLCDPVRRVIGAVHCGWRGSVNRIIGKVVSAMSSNYGTVPADVHGWISPSLGPCCAEFINHRDELPRQFRDYMVKENYFDFWQISRFQLIQAGLLAASISIRGHCTCCRDDYFSYRRAKRKLHENCGRNCSVISLP